MSGSKGIEELRSKLKAAEQYEERCLDELQSAEYVLNNAKRLTQIARERLVMALEEKP